MGSEHHVRVEWESAIHDGNTQGWLLTPEQVCFSTHHLSQVQAANLQNYLLYIMQFPTQTSSDIPESENKNVGG